MNKEPIGLYIFRFVLGFGLFAFMCMLYWSSTLIEDQVKEIHTELSELKSDLFNLKSSTHKILEELMRYSPSATDSKRSVQSPITPPLAQSSNRENPNIDMSLTNLLEEDPFYAVTLPKLLPQHFKPHGTFQNATIGKPHNLHPFSSWNQISAWISYCIPAAATNKFGHYEAMAPELAIKIEERLIPGNDVPEFWVHLRDNVFWEPIDPKHFPEMILAPHFLKRHQVTAEDFKFYYDAIMNSFVYDQGAISLRNYIGDIEKIEIVDKLTFIVRWKSQSFKQSNGDVVKKINYIARRWTGNLRPLASFIYKYFSDGTKIVENDDDPETYRTNSVWAQNFSQHWAKNIIPSCGAWIFEGMTDREIRFKRNPNYYNPLAALGQNIVISFRSTPDAIWQDFKNDSLDSYGIQPDQILALNDFLNSKQYSEQADKNSTINRLDYLARSYTYIGWNQTTPFFGSKKVRRAMTMAIDRQRIINQNLNGLGVEITGSFFVRSKAADPAITPWPFDPMQAKKLLEEEGWYDSDGDGVLDKIINGKKVPFEFSLLYYVKNPLTKSIAEYISTALKEIGIVCRLNGVDLADLSAKLDEKSFDAIFLAWSLGTPPPEPRQLWHSEGAKQQGSSNHIGFVNKEADSIIEQLQYEYNEKKRIDLYHQFDRILHEEQPYTFLYTPKATFLYRDYLKNVFIPADRQDLIPGADVTEPESGIFWLNKRRPSDKV